MSVRLIVISKGRFVLKLAQLRLVFLNVSVAQFHNRSQ